MENFKWNSYENACWCFQIVHFRAFYFCSANFISFMNEILHSNEKNRTERERYVCVHEIHCSVKYSNTLYVSLFDSFIESSLHFSHEKFSLFTFISSFSSFIWVKGLISKVVEYFFVGKFGPSKIVWDCIRLKDEFSQKISFFSFSKRKSLFSNE